MLFHPAHRYLLAQLNKQTKMAALRGLSVVQLVFRGSRTRLVSSWRAYSNGTPFSSVPGEPKLS